MWKQITFIHHLVIFMHCVIFPLFWDDLCFCLLCRPQLSIAVWFSGWVPCEKARHCLQVVFQPLLSPLSFRILKIRVPFPFPVRYGVCVANSLFATATTTQNFISATVMSLQKTDTAPVLPWGCLQLLVYPLQKLFQSSLWKRWKAVAVQYIVGKSENPRYVSKK